MLHPFLPERRYFQMRPTNPRQKTLWVQKSEELGVLSGGGICPLPDSGWSDCASSSSSCICNLEERLFWIILAMETYVIWKHVGEVLCSPALGYSGRAGVPPSCKEVIPLITWKKEIAISYGYVSHCALMEEFVQSNDFFFPRTRIAEIRAMLHLFFLTISWNLWAFPKCWALKFYPEIWTS